MDGPPFLSWLHSLGFPDPLSEEACDWALQQPCLQSLVPWLTQAVTRRDNVLSLEEMDRFAVLQQQERRIFEGQELGEALQHREVMCRRTSTFQEEVSHVQEEMEDLEEELQFLQRQAARAKHQRDVLQTHVLSQQKHSVASRALAEGQQRISEQRMQVYELSEEFGAALQKLSSAFDELVSCHNPPESNPNSASNSLLAFSRFNNYHEGDDQFCFALKKYMQTTQSSQTAAVRPGIGSHSVASVLQSEEEILLIRGEPPEEREAYARELERLKDSYPLTMKQRVEVSIRLAEMQAMRSHLENISEKEQLARMLPAGQFSVVDISTWRNQAQEAAMEAESAQDDLRISLRKQLPALSTELSSLSRCEVLRGDYLLKSARQEYQLRRQEKIIGELVTQSSRHLFLQLCLQVEAEQVLSNLELLMGTMDHINGEVEKYQQRMDMYGHLMEGDSPLMDSSSGSGAGQHAAIDSSRDAVFAPVRTLLSRLDSTAASSPEALRSRQQVLKRLQSMQSTLQSLCKDEANRCSDLESATKEIKYDVDTVLSMLRQSDTTSNLSLVPTSILELEETVASQCERLTMKLQRVFEERGKRLEQVDRMSQPERALRDQLFVAFQEVNSEQAATQLTELLDKVQARLGVHT